MLRFFLLVAVTGLSQALPQATVCSTETVQVTVPSRTYTYTASPTTWLYPTTAEDLGTFTLINRVPATTFTLGTVTSTSTFCGASASGSVAISYTSAAAKRGARNNGVRKRQDACTVTTTLTTTSGAVYATVTGSVTETFTQYTDFVQETITVQSTVATWTTAAIDSAVTTTSLASCPTALVRDTRCNPALMISAAGGLDNAQYGLSYASNVPGSGAYYKTTAADAGACCQLCADLETELSCAGSSWDVRTGACVLEFPTNSQTAQLNCGESLLAYYDAGPDYPMSPGTGLWVANICGSAEFGSAAPDDGT